MSTVISKITKVFMHFLATEQRLLPGRLLFHRTNFPMESAKRVTGTQQPKRSVFVSQDALSYDIKTGADAAHMSCIRPCFYVIGECVL